MSDHDPDEKMIDGHFPPKDSTPRTSIQRKASLLNKSQVAKSKKNKSKDTSKKHNKKIYCGNNRLDPRLASGELRVGRPSECFKKGFGGGFHQHIPPQEELAFIKKNSIPYEKLIKQEKMWYKDSDPPEGYMRATLSQCRARGWGVGTLQLAKKLKEKHTGHT